MKNFFRPHLWLLRFIGLIVPRRLRADWRQEWEAELQWREGQFAVWDRLNARSKVELLRHSAGAFADALWLQPRRWEDEMIQDLRFAVRMLRKKMGFTIVAVLSLALGIGGTTAMFSLVNRLLIQPLPYRDAERLMRVTEWYPKGAIAVLQEQSRTMEVATYTTDLEFNLTGQGSAMRLAGNYVSANLFSLLSTPAQLGRTFVAGEDRPGRDGIVILSNSLWRNKFGGDPNIIGRPISIDGQAREVVGVMPPDFGFPSPKAQVWIPVRFDATNRFEYWEFGWMPLIARLRGEATESQARQELQMLIARIIPSFPWKVAADWNAKSTVVPLQEDMTKDVRGKLLLLLSAVGCVLLIGCVNVASLLLVRISERQREIAVRAALGAGRGRIVRQLLTESVLLALLGAGLGLLLAEMGLSALKTALPSDDILLATARIDWQVLTFVAALSLLTGLAFGIAPALHAAKLELAAALKTRGHRDTGIAGGRLRGVLIVVEVALAVSLVIGACLLTRSLWILTRESPGFRSEQLVTLRVYPPAREHERLQLISLYDELMRRARNIAGVSAVVAANATPLGSDVPIIPVKMDDRNLPPGQDEPLFWSGAVTPGYFQTLQIPLLAGRLFTEADSAQAEPVVLIDAATARQYWPNENPVGKRFRVVWEDRWRRIVGVVGAVRQFDLTGKSPDYIKGTFYMPYEQSTGLERKMPAEMTLILRTAADAPQVAGELRTLIASVNPDMPMSEFGTLDAAVTASTLPARSLMWIFICFGGAALLLAAIGTYGVISHATAQRTYEIGMRMAFGATPRQIFSMVIRQSFRVVLAGLTLGMLTSLGFTRLMTGYLYGVAATDPVTFFGVGLLLLFVALMAGYVPARRAASVDPLIAIRQE